MAEFGTDLVVKVHRTATKASFELVEPLRFSSEWFSHPIVVPVGFKTDGASVPRLPLAFMLTGATAMKAAVVHDWLLVRQISKDTAAKVFLEAMVAEGVTKWRRTVMYWAVKLWSLWS